MIHFFKTKFNVAWKSLLAQGKVSVSNIKMFEATLMQSFLIHEISDQWKILYVKQALRKILMNFIFFHCSETFNAFIKIARVHIDNQIIFQYSRIPSNVICPFIPRTDVKKYTFFPIYSLFNMHSWKIDHDHYDIENTIFLFLIANYLQKFNIERYINFRNHWKRSILKETKSARFQQVPSLIFPNWKVLIWGRTCLGLWPGIVYKLLVSSQLSSLAAPQTMRYSSNTKYCHLFRPGTQLLQFHPKDKLLTLSCLHWWQGRTYQTKFLIVGLVNMMVEGLVVQPVP